MTVLAIAICTWNNADSLRRVLERLAQQIPPVTGVEVLVVDNNSSDHTAAVVEEFVGRIAGLRSVREITAGLTPARVRSVNELSSADWIAFVDDDCLLDVAWCDNAARICRSVDESIAAIGGMVELSFEIEPPEWIHSIRGAFAEQRPRSDAAEVGTLVGAGMIVRRQSLVSSGWLGAPMLEDRVGSSLVSGGDVEIATRLAGIGRLWFDPMLRLSHQIPPWRTTEGYALRLQRGLGSGALLIDELRTNKGLVTWAASSMGRAVAPTSGALRWWVSARLRRSPTLPPRLILAYWSGWTTAWWARVRSPRSFRGGSIADRFER